MKSWETLVQAIKALSSAKTLQDTMEIVSSTARDIVAADGITLVRRDKDMCHYVDERAIGPLWKGQSFPLTSCISGWCILNGKSVAISDISIDERIPQDAYQPTFVKSLVMVPIRMEENVAAMGAYWANIRDFDSYTVTFVETLAQCIGEATLIAKREKKGLRNII